MGISRLSTKQSWTATWTPGVNLTNLFALYDSLGDVTINTPTSVPTTLDGPIQMARYGALTVNAAMTAAQRCRGLMLLADSLIMGAAGSISMTARGAAGAKNWAVGKDIFVPQSITFTGKNTSYADFLKWIRTTGYCIFDPSLYACPPPGMGDVQCDWATWAPFDSTIISAAGCGSPVLMNGYQGSASTGGAGSNAPGAGGGGGQGPGSNTYQSGRGRVWGGGCGSGGSSGTGLDATSDQYGGIGGSGTSGNGNTGGGGAGNPGGSGYAQGAAGTGGVLIVICRGSVTLATGHVLSATGSAGGASVGGSQAACGGGGSGGGLVALFYGGSMTGTPNLSAAGGAGGPASGAQSYNLYGGAGGAGTTRAATFAAIGWS